MLCTAVAPTDAAGPSPEDRLKALQTAYPEAIKAIEGNAVVLVSGAPLKIDDGREQKDHQAKLADADVEDMLAQIYPIGACDDSKPPAVNFDPGRIRVTKLFTAMYGASAAEVKARTTTIDWFGQKLPVTQVNGVDKALARVRDDLAALPQDLHKYFRKSAGTFNWRVIAGTTTPSVHSFAAAIDIDIAYADYWRWAGGKPGAVKAYRNRVPPKVVEVFERHDFIWGGKWYHYDTMHFEYRPELIAIGRLHEKNGCK